MIVLTFAARCRGAELPPSVIEFFRRRDQWLMSREMPSPKSDDGIPNELRRLNAAKNDREKALLDEKNVRVEQVKHLKPIEKRLFRNVLKNDKSLASIIAKDKKRVAEIKDAIAKSKARSGAIEAEIARAQSEIDQLQKDFNDSREERTRTAIAERSEASAAAKKRVLVLRKDMSLMPPDSKLDGGRLSVGAIGTAPPWPIGLDKLPSHKRQRVINAIIAVQAGLRPEMLDKLELDEIGGEEPAKKKHNLRVIQVFDNSLLLVSFIGGERIEWRPFLLDVGDTSPYADGETFAMHSLVYVSGTRRYTAVDGAAATRFVVRIFDARDLPPMTD